MANQSDFFGVVGGLEITAVHQGIIAIPSVATQATATVPSVDLSRSIVFTGAQSEVNLNNDNRHRCAYVELLNGTTVSATRNTSGSTAYIPFYVYEFASAVSVQQLVITPASGDQNIAVTEVNPDNSLFVYRGGRKTNADDPRFFAAAYLSSSTNVFVQGSTNAGSTNADYYTLIDFG
jgi:hypothetical protein